MTDLTLTDEIVYPVAANRKLVIQSYSECLHRPLLHPQLELGSHLRRRWHGPHWLIFLPLSSRRSSHAEPIRIL